MLVGVLAAYALSRMRSRSNALSLWIIANRIALPTAFAIPYFLVYRELEPDRHAARPRHHLPDLQHLAGDLADAFVFLRIPRAPEEAAWIEGAGFWQGLLRIVLPTAVPGLAATAILGRMAPLFLRNRSDSAE
jgi:multiple sugar transport system permease protein